MTATSLQVAKHVQPLVDLRAMFAADSADAYLLAYSSLLQACPGISPAILEKLIHARSDLGKSEVRQVRKQCVVVSPYCVSACFFDVARVSRTRRHTRSCRSWSSVGRCTSIGSAC